MSFISFAPEQEKEVPSPFKGLGSFLFFGLIIILVRSLLISPFRIPSGSMIPTCLVGDHILASKFPYGWSRYSMLFGGTIPYFQGKIFERHFPKRGDVIVFANPLDPREDWIKRVVGIPGDVVEMIEGRLHLNGQSVPLTKVKDHYESFDGQSPIQGTLYKAEIPRENNTYSYTILKQKPFGEGDLDHLPPVTVGKDEVFLMGDNWDGSSDSRVIDRLGCVSKDYFLGQALFIFFSLDHEKISLWKPWTWLLIPFKIRYNRCLFHRLP